MTINIFVLKGDLNGKIVVVRFFFCWVYNIKHYTIFSYIHNRTKHALFGFKFLIHFSVSFSEI